MFRSISLLKSPKIIGRYGQYNPLISLIQYSQTSESGRMPSSSPPEKELPKPKRCEFCKDYDILTDKFDQLKQDNDTLLDKYRRALAEIENSRKRGERQVEEAKVFAIQGFCKDLIGVADVLDLAVESLEKELNQDEALRSVYEGINMTKNSLLKAFAKHGLVQIHPDGQKFDPSLHEAVFEVPEEQSGHPPGHVSHVLSIGYSLHNRPVRPAKVGVVKLK